MSADSSAPFVAGYEIATDPGRLDIGMIHRFLAEESYWSAGIAREAVEKSIANSLNFGVYRGAEQVGFARIVTDRTFFALLADVFVLREHRGKGLSKWLMRSVMDHEDLQGLRRMLLLTSDAHELYRQYGFGELENGWRFMERLGADAFRAPGR